MRVVPLSLLFTLVCLSPAPAVAQAPDGQWNVAVGPHVIRREASSESHIGGGVTVALGTGRLAAVVEGGGTRREGHNDWRVLGGPRINLTTGRHSLFLQGLGGVLIRQKTTDWAVMPGLGLDVGWAGNRAVRFQIDAPVERAQSRTVAGVRGSVWLVWR
jgi:hypothetical protein